MFATSEFRCVEMGEADIGRLQRFFEENPEYHRIVDGRRPRPNEAREEFDSRPPADWPQGKRWLLEFRAPAGEMIGIANVLEDLLARGVWNLGLFIVATRLHGTGIAARMHAGLEAWARGAGARWLRLGVVAGNTRAERFWERLGYLEVRRRHDVAMGVRTNTLRVMVKPLADAGLAEYLALVARDRTESA